MGAALTIGLAGPRLMAGVTEAPMEDAVAALAASPSTPAAEAVRRILAVTEHAAAIHSTAATWSAIGLLDLKESLAVGPATPSGRAALDASINAHRKALALDPADAYAWTRLVQAMLMRDGAQAKGLEPVLTAAVAASPYDSRLVVARADVGLAAWNRLSERGHALIGRQIRVAAAQSPTALATIARDRFALHRVLTLLEDEPRLLERFAYAYSQR